MRSVMRSVMRPRLHPTRRHLVQHAAVLAAAGVALPRLSYAQAFPNKPIRYIRPWPAGGSTDAVIRALAESAGKLLGQNIIVDNKAGAGGLLGANELVNAKPDGHTLSQLPHGVFRIPHMQKVQFDVNKDFTWIACLTGYTFGLVVVSDSPFGVCGPKGMDAGLVRSLHDVFKQTLQYTAVLASFDKYDQSVICMNTETYTKFARDSFVTEKATIERLGLANKG
jgi:tripartite-type tricarboxylate transporter receptor subunit TctC